MPSPLEIATHDGDAWMSLVAFRLRVRPRWAPFLPMLSDLVEVNLRTYVRLGNRTGIWFLSVMPITPWLSGLTRRLTPIPYVFAPVQYQQQGGGFRFHAPRGAANGVSIEIAFGPVTQRSMATSDSEDDGLWEQHRLFVFARTGVLMQADVSHPRWNIPGGRCVGDRE